jgi:hypothetical protein
LRIFSEQVVGGEDHAGGADAALGSATLEEALLDGVKMLRQIYGAGLQPLVFILDA